MTRDSVEGPLAARILDALLREDYGGLRSRVAPDGRALVLPTRRVRLTAPETPFLSAVAVDPGQALRLGDVFRAVRAVADPRDDVDAFERECRDALTVIRLHEDARPAVLRRLARIPDALRVGPGVFYEALAAYNDHPVHPMGRSRTGLSMADVSRYAPEFAQSFPLRWAAVRDATRVGEHPAWWPGPSEVGLRGDEPLFPVHPLAVPHVRDEPGAFLAPDPYLQVTPTLSMRTVTAGPRCHVKVPLPTSTLGLRNRRTIVPGTLPDGALVERLLRRVLEREDLPVLLADEQTYGHADSPLLAYLVRRFPPETERAHIVPVAALLAEAPEGGHVIERWDVEALFGDYLSALFSWNVTLFGYGIALEAHQQNVALVLDDGAPLRLLVKDNDGALIDTGVLGSRLAPSAGTDPRDLIDRRMTTRDPDALARVFVTITLHLCAAAPAFGLAERGLLPLRTGLGLVRDRLDAALGAGHGFLRSRTLDAAALPGKAMLTAGTLVDKARTGAADINKHYGPSGPNYLRDTTCC
ncbi:IucA/IucC family protein [Spirillospora albida]|uniref:IucA/IucC family protein n=1 Tax=Spirillospora albida TaxID=58123 RepID=UPI0004C138EC|nr:IucA/IucC family protein [Spirillospora albida]